MEKNKTVKIVAAIAASVLVMVGIGSWEQRRAEKAYEEKLLDDKRNAAVNAVKAADAALGRYVAAGKDDRKGAQQVAQQLLDALSSATAFLEAATQETLTPTAVSAALRSAQIHEPYLRIRAAGERARSLLAEMEQSALSLESQRTELAELEEGMKGFEHATVVCSRAFGQVDDHISLECMDMGRGARVVVLAPQTLLAHSSVPFNGRFPVINEGMKPMVMNYSNGYSHWTANEMFTVLRIADPDTYNKKVADRKSLNAKISALVQRLSDLGPQLHSALVVREPGKSGAVAFSGYASLVQDIRYGGNGNVDFANMTFPSLKDPKVVLKEGEYQSQDPVSTFQLGEVRKLDFNGDGQQDYVLTLISSSGAMVPVDDYEQFLAVRESGKIRIANLDFNSLGPSESEVRGADVILWRQQYQPDWTLKRLGEEHALRYRYFPAGIVTEPLAPRAAAATPAEATGVSDSPVPAPQPAFDPVAVVQNAPSRCNGLSNQEMFTRVWGTADWGISKKGDDSGGYEVTASGRVSTATAGKTSAVYRVSSGAKPAVELKDVINANGSIASRDGNALFRQWIDATICPMAVAEQ